MDLRLVLLLIARNPVITIIPIINIFPSLKYWLNTLIRSRCTEEFYKFIQNLKKSICFGLTTLQHLTSIFDKTSFHITTEKLNLRKVQPDLTNFGCMFCFYGSGNVIYYIIYKLFKTSLNCNLRGCTAFTALSHLIWLTEFNVNLVILGFRISHL